MRNCLFILLILSSSLCFAQKREKDTSSWSSLGVGLGGGDGGLGLFLNAGLTYSYNSYPTDNILLRTIVKSRIAYVRENPMEENGIIRNVGDFGVLLGESFGKEVEFRVAAGVGAAFGKNFYHESKFQLGIPVEITISGNTKKGGFGVSAIGNLNRELLFFGASITIETGIRNFPHRDIPATTSHAKNRHIQERHPSLRFTERGNEGMSS